MLTSNQRMAIDKSIYDMLSIYQSIYQLSYLVSERKFENDILLVKLHRHSSTPLQTVILPVLRKHVTVYKQLLYDGDKLYLFDNDYVNCHFQ